MKIDFFKEKYFDLILINNQSVAYFRLAKEKTKIEVLKSEKIEANIYSQGIFHLPNLQPTLEILFKKYKLTELGIVLNTPNIVFQKINLPRGTSDREAIINYLKTNFPLPIEKYALFYQEDKYRTLTSLATYNIFLIDREIINNLLDIVEKYGLMPIFISPTIEIFYRYLLNKAILDFNEEYLIFLQAENSLITALIRNLRLEKIITEEIDFQKTNLDLVISRIYDFFKLELKPQTKIIFFSQEKIQFTGSYPALFFPSPTINVILEGSYFAFQDILAERPIIDFMPVKNYKVYFFNRLPSIITLLSVYILFLLILISLAFFSFEVRLNNELKNLSSQIKQVSAAQNEPQLQNLKNLVSSIEPQNFDKFSLIVKIKELPGIENINFEQKEIIFNLKIDSQNLEKIKYQISQNFPSAKLIEESTSENEVRLKYKF
jgi:hypothetical protein